MPKRPKLQRRRLSERLEKLFEERYVFLPRAGERIREENLTPVSKKAYSRISQISDIPLETLLPSMATEMPRYLSGGYDFTSHQIGIKDGIGEPSKRPFVAEKTADEELQHGLQGLFQETPMLRARKTGKPQRRQNGRTVSANKAYYQQLREKPGIEATARVHINRRQAFGNAVMFPAMVLPFLGLNYKAILGLFAVTASRRVFNTFVARGYYKRHGTDGLILLFADPPKNWSMLRLRAKERFFINNGFLERRGGLTEKGIGYFRQKAPKEKIMENLRIMRGQQG
ncbi:MAG: hypothetical protein NT067_02920 [Candidatus Diapherotrites archaeon]|nr:hypothetical protein [Candidatus Diapherotrites archaeon]